MKKYDTMPAELRSALQATADIPVDLDPTFAFKNAVD